MRPDEAVRLTANPYCVLIKKPVFLLMIEQAVPIPGPIQNDKTRRIRQQTQKKPFP